MIFVGFFPWETICFSNTIFLIKWFGNWSTWAHTEYIFRKVEHMTEYGKKSLQAIMATRKFSAYSKENIISVKGTSKDAVSGSLYLTLKMDTCVAVWNGDNSILNRTCQVASNTETIEQ